MFFSYRLRLPDKELVIDLVHGGKVAHVDQEDIHLDHILETAPRGVEDGRQVLECLALATGKYGTNSAGRDTYRPILHTALDKLGGAGVDAKGARAVHHAAVLDRLRQLRDGLWRLVGEDCCWGRHAAVSRSMLRLVLTWK